MQYVSDADIKSTGAGRPPLDWHKLLALTNQVSWLSLTPQDLRKLVGSRCKPNSESLRAIILGRQSRFPKDKLLFIQREGNFLFKLR